MRTLFPASKFDAGYALAIVSCLLLSVTVYASGFLAADSHKKVDTTALANATTRVWRIMPVGDSITEAEASFTSYRRPLWRMLDAAGIETDFVGSRSGNRDGEILNADFDTDHQARWGWRADKFLENNRIDRWSAEYMPDIILVHLGTNDIFQDQSVSTTIDDIRRIVEIVRGNNPQVIALVAQIIPHSRSDEPSLVPFNEAIPDLVASLDSENSPVRVVDQYSGFDATTDTYDGVHPNRAGEDKIAQKWFDALQPFLSTNGAPAFTSEPVTSVQQGNPYAYAVTAQDPDGDAVSITSPEIPDWLTLVDNGDGTGNLSGTPDNAAVGENLVRLVATDPSGSTGEQAFTIDVSNRNDEPEFTSNPEMAATESAEYTYAVTAQDPDADSLRITAPTLPGWLTLSDGGNGSASLSGTPSGADVGVHDVVLQAQETDTADGLDATQSFVVTVTAAPEGPEIELNGDASVTIDEGDSYDDAGATASDMQDGDLTPQIQTENPVDSDVPGTYTVTYSVTDSAGNEAQATRTVTVRASQSTTVEQSGGGGGAWGLFELFVLLLSAAALRAAEIRLCRLEPVLPKKA